jgi:PTH1 family peptidyl-tRNA hydrolase
MNLSGGPVSKLIRVKGIRLQEVLVVHDDIDMEFGRIRIRWMAVMAGIRVPVP